MGTIKIEKDGKLYEVEYFVVHGDIRIYGERGQESASLGGLTEQQDANFSLKDPARKDYIKTLDSELI